MQPKFKIGPSKISTSH